MLPIGQQRNLTPRIRSLASGVALVLMVGLVPAVFPTFSAQAATLTVVHFFLGGGIDGAYPVDNGFLARDSSGNLYGTTFGGGAYGFGCVFKLRMKAKETVLYDFAGGSDGANPFGGVMLDSQGDLYGTTENGGAYGFGTVFKLSKGKETVLYSFSGGADGGTPYASVVSDSSGTLYGTTYQGGAHGFGTVYMVSSVGEETVLYSFSNGADGGFPNAGLMFDQGSLYGTTTNGGAYGYGIVFTISSAGKETVLHSFTGGADGGGPYSGVISDAQGNLYGTTFEGGKYGFGTVFRLSSAGKETVLHSFLGPPDGAEPYAGLVFDRNGNLYGTTAMGGTNNYGAASGVVFKVSKAGKETVLCTFGGRVVGDNPLSGLVSDDHGHFYGVAYQHGETGYGTLFKCIP